MKIVFVRNPHARQAGKVMDLADAAQRLIHQVRIEHRTFDIPHVRQGVGWRLEIENARLSTPRDQRRYQVPSDETAAAGDKARVMNGGADRPNDPRGKAKSCATLVAERAGE